MPEFLSVCHILINICQLTHLCTPFCACSFVFCHISTDIFLTGWIILHYSFQYKIFRFKIYSHNLFGACVTIIIYLQFLRPIIHGNFIDKQYPLKLWKYLSTIFLQLFSVFLFLFIFVTAFYNLYNQLLQINIFSGFLHGFLIS